MSVEATVVYEGGLRCRATHGPSGNSIVTDAPADNHGRGEAFSPTDLVCTALGACMMTIMGIVAERDKVDLSGTKVRVIKEMETQPVRRIGKITVEFNLPSQVSEDERRKLETAAHACPVCRSLHPDVQRQIAFKWTMQRTQSQA